MQKSSFPLHPAQQDVFFDQLVNEESPHYNVGGYIRLEGALDKEKLRETLQTVPEVFDVFKMGFGLAGDEPRGYWKEDDPEYAFTELDFSSGEDAGKKALAWMQERFNAPFVIKKDNHLYELFLLKVGEREYYFYNRYHHLITDGYGFSIWAQYVAKKYSSLLKPGRMDFVYPSYHQESIKGNVYYGSAGYQKEGKYWKEKIKERPAIFLQKQYKPLNGSLQKCGKYVLDITGDRMAEIEKIALERKASLQQLTIAALLIYFGQTSSQTDFVFGIPVHKRRTKELRNIVGTFSGVLPFRGTYHPSLTLSMLLKQISSSQRSDYRNQNYLLADLSRELSSASSKGFLDVFVNYELLDFELDFGPDLHARTYELVTEFSQYPFKLLWRDYGKQQPLELSIDFQREYFSEEEIALLAERIFFILSQFPGSPDKEIGNIRIIPPQEQKFLQEASQGMRAAYPKDMTVTELFEAQVGETPDEPALVFGDLSLSYRELDQRSNQLAHFLKAEGVRVGSLVATCLSRSPGMIIGILGILKAGGAYIPIDSAYPNDRIRFMLEDTGAGIVLCSPADEAALRNSCGARILVWEEVEDRIRKEPVTKVEAGVDVCGLAYVLFTSGSTGLPKGVMVTHRNITSLVKGDNYSSLGRKDILLSTGSPSFDATTFEYWGMLLNGGQLVLCPETRLLDSGLMKEEIKRRGVNKMWFTASWFNQLVDTDSTVFEGLETILVGGERLSEDHIKRVKLLYPALRIINGYGPTENTTFSLTYAITGKEEGNGIPVGKPLANRSACILNERLGLCPVGITGELYTGGDGVALGYLNRTELTAENFMAGPLSGLQENGGGELLAEDVTHGLAEGGWERIYKTGDLCRWLADGNIEYLGRKDEQV
ncbi:non-ribosomal peptide synthetase, partial [Flavitalea flava]